MGIFPRWSIRIFASTLSTQTTSFPLSAKQAPATSPTYPVPTTAIFNQTPDKNSRGYHLMERPTTHASHLVRILVDYRPALRARTGVGEYIHQIVRAYTAVHDDAVDVFTASWKDRPAADTASRLSAGVVDRRIPVRLLNYLW